MTSSLTILPQRDATIDLSEDGFIHTRSEARILKRVIGYFCKTVRRRIYFKGTMQNILWGLRIMVDLLYMAI
jgi:hypothetical protein